MPTHRDFDLLLIGGGLQNGLLTLGLLRRQRHCRIGLIEQAESFGGNHTWCFYSSDVPATAADYVEPLVVHRWPSYDVEFPDQSRTVRTEYLCCTSERLDAVVREQTAGSNVELFLGRTAVSIAPNAVQLDDGRVLTARKVIDARGPERLSKSSPHAYQKFLGLELALKKDADARTPLLMDARVQQLDGFRFVYVLPFTSRRLLVEDTYFSDTPVLDRTVLRERVFAYARLRGFEVEEVMREESGVLPLPLERLPTANASCVQLGYQGGLFHPVTGYSFPVALRVADLVARHGIKSFENGSFEQLLGTVRRQARYCLLLNRLLFRAFAPEQRYHVLERFYRLPRETIERFYSLRMTPADRAKIICGRPPRGFSVRLALTQGL